MSYGYLQIKNKNIRSSASRPGSPTIGDARSLLSDFTPDEIADLRYQLAKRAHGIRRKIHNAKNKLRHG